MTNLINRHISDGEMVLPRTRGRFEPEPNAAVSSPTNDQTKEHNSIDEQTSADQPLIELRESIARSKEAIEQKTPMSAINTPAESSVELPLDRDNVHKNADSKLDRPKEEFFKTSEIENSTNDKIQIKHTRLGSSDKQGYSDHPARPHNPIPIAMNKTHEGFYNQQSDQHQPATTERALGPSMNLLKPEEGMIESQPGATNLRNTHTVSHGLLGTPPRHNESDKGLLTRDANVESEPIIRVTIGRIDVRAISPPTSNTKKRREAPPVMRLEEYLEQRSKGRGE